MIQTILTLLGQIILAIGVLILLAALTYYIGSTLSPSKCSNCPAFNDCCKKNFPMCVKPIDDKNKEKQ